MIIDVRWCRLKSGVRGAAAITILTLSFQHHLCRQLPEHRVTTSKSTARLQLYMWRNSRSWLTLRSKRYCVVWISSVYILWTSRVMDLFCRAKLVYSLLSFSSSVFWVQPCPHLISLLWQDHNWQVSCHPWPLRARSDLVFLVIVSSWQMVFGLLSQWGDGGSHTVNREQREAF